MQLLFCVWSAVVWQKSQPNPSSSDFLLLQRKRFMNRLKRRNVKSSAACPLNAAAPRSRWSASTLPPPQEELAYRSCSGLLPFAGRLFIGIVLKDLFFFSALCREKAEKEQKGGERGNKG